MPMTTDSLTKAYEQLRGARATMKYATKIHEHCHEVADHVLALIEYEKLRPKTFYAETYTELQLEIGLLDVSYASLKKEFESLEKWVKEATNTIAEAQALGKLGAAAPTKQGVDIEQVFDAEIDKVAFIAQNLNALSDVYQDHAKTVRTLLGI